MENITKSPWYPSHLPQLFLETDLVSFGNFLFTEYRASMTTDNVLLKVTDADLSNWKDTLEGIPQPISPNAEAIINNAN